MQADAGRTETNPINPMIKIATGSRNFAPRIACVRLHPSLPPPHHIGFAPGLDKQRMGRESI